MYTCQQSLIVHLGKQFSTPDVKTIEAYAGHLRREETHKLTQLIPAILAVYIDGNPIAEDSIFEYDLLVITDSRVLDSNTNTLANMQLSDQVTAYLKSKPFFWKLQGGGTYYVNPEKVSAKTLAITNRFTIVAIKLYIEDRTQLAEA